MYLIGGRHIEPQDVGFTEVLAEAYALRIRPRCLCNPPGIEMYVARLGGAYLIKRMPYTGSQHDPDCLSYEPPVELSADGHREDSAIVEDPDTGLTTVRLEFALSHRPSRPISQDAVGGARSVRLNRSFLSLGGLLHYLWNQAGLTRWRPEFEGKRNWATVRRLLLTAAASVIVKGEVLRNRLFVPEAFTVERRREIDARRAELFYKAAPLATGLRRLLLLCAEVKEISPSRHGCSAIIKHVPDQPFALDQGLFRHMEERFEQELSLWGATDGCRMVMLATFRMGPAGVPTIEQLTLMPVDARWIPVRDTHDLRLIEHLVKERRRFIKVAPADSCAVQGRASIVLTDVDDRPVLLRISLNSSSEPEDGESRIPSYRDGTWTWRADSEAIPVLAPAARTIADGLVIRSSRP